MNDSLVPISDTEQLDRAAWVQANESTLVKLSDRQASEIRSIVVRFGIPDAERRLKRLLQKKAPGPAPIAQRIVNGVRVTVYAPSGNPEEMRRVRKVTIGETDSLESPMSEDEDGNVILLQDTLGR